MCKVPKLVTCGPPHFSSTSLSFSHLRTSTPYTVTQIVIMPPITQAASKQVGPNQVSRPSNRQVVSSFGRLGAHQVDKQCPWQVEPQVGSQVRPQISVNELIVRTFRTTLQHQLVQTTLPSGGVYYDTEGRRAEVWIFQYTDTFFLIFLLISDLQQLLYPTTMITSSLTHHLCEVLQKNFKAFLVGKGIKKMCLG